MFKILRLAFSNWDCWRPVAVPLDEPIVMLAGPNGSGKTTFLDGIRIILNAPRLSTKRRRNKYMRDRRSLTVVTALVSNQGGEGRKPFRCLNLEDPTITLACVLAPTSTGVESRYMIIPGDATFQEVQAAFKAGRTYGPGEYSDILFRAGVSRSLLSILAIEQGETNKLCERSPQELFAYVMQIKGQREVFDRYSDAKASYHKALAELEEQHKRLAVEQGALAKLEHQKREYDAYLDRQRLVKRYGEELLPLAEYKEALADAKRLGPDLENGQARLAALQTDLANLEAFHEKELSARTAREAQYQALKARGEELNAARGPLAAEARGMEQGFARLEILRQAAEEVPEEDLDDLKADLEVAEEAVAEVRSRIQRLESQRQELAKMLASLQQGQVVFPPYVNQMRDILGNAQISGTLIAEALEVTDRHWQVAIESIAGGDRFGWIVERDHHVAAMELARRNRYRHYMNEPSRDRMPTLKQGSCLSKLKVHDERVPRWLLDRLNDTALVEDVAEGKTMLDRFSAAITADGYKVDRRGGIFVGVRPGECYLGQMGVSSRAAEGLEQMKELDEELKEARSQQHAFVREVGERRQALTEQEKRREWEGKAAEHAEISARRTALLTQLESMEAELEAARNALVDGAHALSEARAAAQQAEAELARLRREIETLAAQLANRGPQLAAVKNRMAELEAQLKPELRTPEALASVPLPDVVRMRIHEMHRELEQYSGCTDENIVLLYERQAENVKAQDTFVERRMGEVSGGEAELKACRQSYIKLVEQVVSEYRDYALGLASKANIELRMELPKLSAEDDSIEKAGIHVLVAYDGKEPKPLSDPDLSGGQKVIISLLLLMALTDSDGAAGPGFFILDEPFAHLSVERIDEVGEFLRNSRAQFILTTPTTHNHNVFNPAKLTITLFKKPSGEKLAPPPVVCRVS